MRRGLSLYRFTASDGVSLLHVTLFNNKYAAAKIKKGEDYLFFGTVTGGFRRAEMASPLIEPAEGGARIRPIYPQTEGLTSRVIETVVANTLLALGNELDDDPLPFSLRQAHQLCTRRYALDNIHFPADHRALSVARRRLVFEELLLLQLGLLRLKGRSRAGPGPGSRGMRRRLSGLCSLFPRPEPSGAPWQTVSGICRAARPCPAWFRGTWAAAKPPWPPAWRSL